MRKVAQCTHNLWDDALHERNNARYLIKNCPELATIAVDVLEEGLKIVKSKMNGDALGYYTWARNDLQSLRDWEGHRDKRITGRIDGLLRKYKQKR
jgi:hypothetical protein